MYIETKSGIEQYKSTQYGSRLRVQGLRLSCDKLRKSDSMLAFGI
jgi:hypothetical protein